MPHRLRGFCPTSLRQNCDRVESSHNRVQSFLVRRTSIPDQQVAVGGGADNALMTASNTSCQIDTEVVAARRRELFDVALRLAFLVLRVGNHGFEALLAIR